ncbi:ribonuclease P protein component [Caminibacter sp.]
MSGLNSYEIKNIYKRGRKYYTKYFTFFFLSCEFLRVAPVVSKKISKKAVVRNKIKRRIRHLAKEFLNRGKFVIVANCDISEIDFEILKDDFKKISGKINKGL